MPLSTDLLLIVAGIVAIIVSGLRPYIARHFGWRTWSRHFATPQLRVRAQKQEEIAQFFGILTGMGFLFLGNSMLFAFSSTTTMLVLGVWCIGFL
ncbi:MAG: hypothetical protein GFH27_549289n325 [Chloroflexi bacterium AL-W]|nr:hypothetical protein [Chloroflexi bacterium AL-N1]NOK67057.1 hypothetical protein [Chloroflexi bacterium AL-N10]NOK74651.1 hypothetical protein [Chloroflexi bacterium AL-N5]NOK81659.1 hypothetical protein [Chloroflexi bacterium AL-W]NOK89129.1 hypothetical protein [Chloroflexi bacterium AL-N15]